MQNEDTFSKLHHASRKRDRLVLWLTIFLSAASLIVAGALGAAVRTGGTGQHFAFGVIEDFGSIVVNGVHYDETHASIIVNGVPNQARSALKLGMVVEIEGEIDCALRAGTATVVRANRSLLGQVDNVNAAKGEMRVLAQRVAIDVSTRFDGVGNFSKVAVGNWVAVHGLNDPARNLFAATLIEVVAPPSPARAEIRGIAHNVHDGRFSIGGLEVISSNSRAENDDFVAVRGQFDTRTATLLATDVSITPEVDTHEEADNEVEGYIADFRSSKNFKVAGVSIDVGNARFSGGTENDLKPGMRITVEGTVHNGLLLAEEINIHSALSKSGESGDALDGENGGRRAPPDR